MKKILAALLLICAVWGAGAQERKSMDNQTVDGYRGIWFTIGQARSGYGDKYSGGLGTYTMKHIPMAVYSPEADKTFFVYGGTPSEERKYLLCMVGCYDHKTGMLRRPVVVYDKGVAGVGDPHDDPTIQLDKEGYVWVFVAGRANKRPGIRYRSTKPYDISEFEYVNESIMAYPQVHYHPEKGFFLFFTRYDGVRRLFYQSSTDGIRWTDYRQIASIIDEGETKSGHYAVHEPLRRQADVLLQPPHQRQCRYAHQHLLHPRRRTGGGRGPRSTANRSSCRSPVRRTLPWCTTTSPNTATATSRTSTSGPTDSP